VRYTLVQELTALGAFRGTTPNPMRLGLDSRSKDVVEPIIRPQVCSVLMIAWH
jgi:valyl-tRNA synthetase